VTKLHFADVLYELSMNPPAMRLAVKSTGGMYSPAKNHMYGSLLLHYEMGVIYYTVL